ncbi:hypothetical protein Clacol_004195 [Clathrus columnatus]|uniref:BTB domain-containing protein n=1 Tax=Clathrus columnatus TaxID=1419009 RepID=A0AAV5ADG7_9AGAM|nr:hypothetical protein Clacol_004195 [Clathrus columnatus]
MVTGGGFKPKTRTYVSHFLSAHPEVMTQDNDWKRHPDLYMSDGTMVLLANSTLFRVYPGLLAKHSNVFEGLTESGQFLPNDAEVYDGCPLVRLQDDPEEVACFLKATMGLCHFERNQPMPYPMASAILRLSSKYMVQSLRRQAIEHFKRIIPQSYTEINKTESYTQVFGSNPSDKPHPFQLLPLFRECQLMSFLPWTYYSICALGFQKLVQGDTFTTMNGTDSEIFVEDKHDARIALLGWKALCTMTRDIRNDTIMSSAKDCKGGSTCNDTMRLTWMQGAAYQIDSQAMNQWGMFKLLANSERPLSPNGRTRNNLVLDTVQPCYGCTKAWLKQEENARNAIWFQLPAIFKLPAWEVLKQEENSGM